MHLETEDLAKRGRPRCAETHDRILCSCKDMLNEVGFADTTIEAIAARAGVGKTTIYRRWRDKGALAMDCLLECYKNTAPRPFTASAREDLTAVLHDIVAVIKGPSGPVLKSVVTACQDDEPLREALHVFINGRREAIACHLKRAQEMGELRRDLCIEATIDMFFGPIFYRLLLGYGELDNRFIDALVDQVFRGVCCNA